MGPPSLIGRLLEESRADPELPTDPLFPSSQREEGVLTRAKNGRIAESGGSPVTVHAEFDSPRVLNAESTVNFNDLPVFRILRARLQLRG